MSGTSNSALSNGTPANGQGSNSVNIRHFNERVILNALRRLGQASKADLSRYVSLTNNTAGVIVKELEERKLIRSEGKRSGGRGQPATLLSLDPDGAHAIGVKFGRRSIDTLLVDFRGHVLDRRHHELDFPMPDEAIGLALHDIAALAERAARRAPAPAWPASASRRPTTWEAGGASWISRRKPTASGTKWTSAARLAAATGLPVFRENDGTAAAVAEMFRGRGRELDSFVHVFIGAAVGGGIVLNGEYYRGATGYGGDIGLMPVGPSRLSTAPAPTRSHDILLTRASINSLIRHLRGNGVAISNRSEVEEAFTRHPRLVGEWLDDCADALVVPLLSSARLLDVEAIVLDGDMPQGRSRKICWSG